MEQRLTRAKAKIAAAGIPYRVPPRELLPERLAGVHAVVYLIFTEGHTASDGDRLVRAELCDEAIRLGWLLRATLPADAEPLVLLALMLLHDGRRAARADADGRPIMLGEQDPLMVGPRPGRGGCRGARAGACAARSRAVPGAGGDRRAPRRGAIVGADRLAADRRALRRDSSSWTRRP